MLVDQSLDPANHYAREAAVSGESDWIEPELRFAIARIDVDMCRFLTFVGVEMEAEAASTKDGGHGPILLRPACRS